VLDLAFSKADDSLWVITRKGGVRCFRRGNWHSVYVSALAGRPRALCAAQDGAIWVGLETGLGKVMFDQHAHVALIKGTSTPVSSVIEYAGEVWVGTELGVYVYNQTGTLLKAPRSERKGLYSYTILTLHCAADKLIWAGTPQGAAFFNGTDWTFLSELAGQQVLAIIQSQDGALWFGTDRGLYRHDGVELNWVQAEKVPHVPVRSIAQAASGQLWIATARGLIRFTPPQVRLDAKIRG
jgi:ligand-binding sensor domain-containing protein